MPPTPTITTLSVARLDIGHSLGISRQIPIGAAVLTARLTGPEVTFTLDSCVLRPSDPTDALLAWLDQHLTAPGTVVAGYQLQDAAALLRRLPGAGGSPLLQVLREGGTQRVLDLSARHLDGPALTFAQACACSGIPCANVDPGIRFAAWCRGDTDLVDHQTQIDVLAAFRLVLTRLTVSDREGQGIAEALHTRFADWLGTAPASATRLHARDLTSPAH